MVKFEEGVVILIQVIEADELLLIFMANAVVDPGVTVELLIFELQEVSAALAFCGKENSNNKNTIKIRNRAVFIYFP